MTERLSDDERQTQSARRRSVWDEQATSYDKRIGWFERRVFGQDHRPWAARHASGDVLEVAVGTGLNLPFYAQDIRLTGIDISPAMLDIARKRATDLGRTVDFREGDAHELPFPDASFDTVVCTLSLCNIPDPDRAVAEMKRVLRPDGRLVLVDHVRSTNRLVHAIQKVIEFISIRVDGDHMTRRPLDQVVANGFVVDERDRFRLGIVERLSAKKVGS